MTARSNVPLAVPFTILVDGQEKAPYHFAGLRADSDKRYRPLIVPTEWCHLKTGDYSIKGYESLVTIERKSLSDLFGTLGSEERRDRFEREHERMSRMEYAAVVIEASWTDILKSPPFESRLHPKSVIRTALHWQQRFGVPWMTLDCRELAEATTYRLLEIFWQHHNPKEKRKVIHRETGNDNTDATTADSSDIDAYLAALG